MLISSTHDELSVYRGRNLDIQNHIILHQPTLDEVERFPEKEYWQMVQTLCATPQSMKSILWDMEQSIDYTEITPWELFYQMLVYTYPVEKTKILFGNLNFREFKPMVKLDDEGNPLIEDEKPVILLVQILENGDEIVIDEYTYEVLTKDLRDMHGLEKDEKMPANNGTKMVLIDDDRDERLAAKNKPDKSMLKNMVSSMVNIEGFKYSHAVVWDMQIGPFLDSYIRTQKITTAKLLMQSGYSGFGVDLSKIDKFQLDWTGDLHK